MNQEQSGANDLSPHLFRVPGSFASQGPTEVGTLNIRNRKTRRYQSCAVWRASAVSFMLRSQRNHQYRVCYLEFNL